MTKKTTEAKLKSDLCHELRLQFPRFVILRLEDKMTHGIPDICVNGEKKATWIEVKYAYAEKDMQTKQTSYPRLNTRS